VRFALEASEELGIAGHCGGEDFERYIAAQLRVGGAIDFAHPARSNRGSNFIMAERASRATLLKGTWNRYSR
jgi:hypothetical protein